MSKSPAIRFIAWTTAILVVIGGAWWWVLHGGSHSAEAALPGPDRLRSSMRAATTADQESGTRSNRERTNTPRKNALAGLYDEYDFQKPAKEQLETYLTSRGRSVVSLQVAWQITGEMEFLREAAAKDPGNPQVLLALATSENTPEAKRKALEAFRQIAPDNALGDYLLAAAEFQDGNSEAALDSLKAATAKPGFDRLKSLPQSELEAAYLTAGVHPLVARALAETGDSFKTSAPLYQVAKQLRGPMEQSQQDENSDATLEYARMGVQLAERTRQDANLLDLLVSVGIDGVVLKNLAPETVITPAGVTAEQRLAEGRAMKEEIKDLVSRSQQVANLSEQDAYHYLDIRNSEGELGALRWLKQLEEERVGK